VVASLGRGSPSAADWPSQPALASVVAEVTRQLLGRCPRAQFVDVFVLQDRSAIDGVLKPFELRLQMAHPRFERLHALLPANLVTAYLNDVRSTWSPARCKTPSGKRTAVPRSVNDIPALKSETGGDIVTTGSIRLVGELIAAVLVDEFRLFTYPVVLGRGQQLFANASAVPRLRLVESQPFRSGIVLLRYRTA
jgi:hypothetical protein